MIDVGWYRPLTTGICPPQRAGYYVVTKETNKNEERADEKYYQGQGCERRQNERMCAVRVEGLT